jgi:hypothetical protein
MRSAPSTLPRAALQAVGVALLLAAALAGPAAAAGHPKGYGEPRFCARPGWVRQWQPDPPGGHDRFGRPVRARLVLSCTPAQD